MVPVLDIQDIMLLSQQLDVVLQPEDSLKVLKNKLSDKINYLIEQDFHALMHLLYRIDINEIKLKQTLQDNQDKDAGKLIADMIIQRQMEKAELRKKFKKKDDSDPDAAADTDPDAEDKW